MGAQQLLSLVALNLEIRFQSLFKITSIDIYEDAILIRNF